jgi:hypothetical protein
MIFLHIFDKKLICNELFVLLNILRCCKTRSIKLINLYIPESDAARSIMRKSTSSFKGPIDPLLIICKTCTEHFKYGKER